MLKTDEAGRVQTPVERRERLLDEFDRSGLSGAKFAALAGIKYSTFATWAARRRMKGWVLDFVTFSDPSHSVNTENPR
jgi:transposase